MGRDLIGDNMPPEEVNIVEDGKDYGWPYCYAARVHDDNFDPKKAHSCENTVAPHITFQAHSAPLGLAFIPESWPAQYRGDLLVVYHGSWNRTEPTGYKVARFDLDENYTSNGESDFRSGFLEGDGVLGRPVDVLFDARGNLFISDDKAGVIYRISQK
jgi:glucose/arabinose dehydrogenase